MTQQDSAFGMRINGLGHLPSSDSAFPLAGLGRRPLVPMPPQGFGAATAANTTVPVLITETVIPPPAQTASPSAAPMCASCTTTNGGIAATAAAADQALREDGCIAGLGQEPEGLGQGQGRAQHPTHATRQPAMQHAATQHVAAPHPQAPQAHPHTTMISRSYPGLPTGIRVLASVPAQCTQWLLAFVNGSKYPNVIIHGQSFGGYQKAINYFSKYSGNSTVFFAFTNNVGTYLFAYEVMNGRHVIKICTNGMLVHATPGGRAKWTVSPASSQQGLGAVFKKESADYLGGNIGFAVIQHVVDGTWTQIGTCDGMGNFTAADPTGQLSKFGDLQNALTAGIYEGGTPMLGELISQWTSGQGRNGGYIYFGLSDPNSGAAQTPGEPPGVAIMRFRAVGGGLYEIDMCISEAASAGVSSGGSGVTMIQVTGPLPPYTGPYQSGVPTSTGLWWYNYQWVYAGGQPPVGVYPPGAQMSPGANGEIGKWVLIGQNQWGWYPPGGALGAAPGTSYGVVVGGDGVTYGVWAQSGAAATLASGGSSTFPPPSAPPPWMASTNGQWIGSGPAYYAWVAPTALATTTSSSTWIWLLLGLAVVGGGAYYILD
jgi:hypothetical protein